MWEAVGLRRQGMLRALSGTLPCGLETVSFTDAGFAVLIANLGNGIKFK